jgi:hypothetical protein
VGTCAALPAGTACAASGCTGGTLTTARTCDGAGTCQAAVAMSCAPFACNASGTSCNNTCATPDDCAPGQPCLNGSCGSHTATCASDTECASGFCSQNVCCATRCDAACYSCAVKGWIGTCVQDPAFDPIDPSICL